ncbi:MAG: ribokinase [Actinobacteria bacterium]|uniref:Ribokinase n=1 Tax=Nostocoides veronense TaxID=330836 RepID=A0ABN2LRC5_9MICO|nr:ribokinase [Actinomycetota bacterium]
MGRVIVIGSINVDQVALVEERPKPGETVLAIGHRQLAGGKGANQAIAAARAGADVLMVGRVGDDSGGAAYLRRLAAHGIDVRHVQVSTERPTGTAFITVDETRENTIVVVPGANSEVGADWPENFPALTAQDVVVLQLEIPLPTVIRAADLAHEAGARVVINVAPYAELPPATLALADPIVANEHEAMALADSGAGVGSLLMTLGPNGAVWDGIGAPAHDVPGGLVIDTTGAGDAFVGALAAALAGGADHAGAVQAALAAGSEAVSYAGAQPDAALGPEWMSAGAAPADLAESNEGERFA